jgi:plastocyanin
MATRPDATRTWPHATGLCDHEAEEASMQTLAKTLAIALTVAGTLVLASCASAAGGAATAGTPTPTLAVGGTVTLGQRAFVQTSVTILAGQSLRIVDPADGGGTHRLCVGADGRCDANATYPAELRAPGLMLRPGDTVVVGFPHAGWYQVTCTIHPSMNLTVSVLPTGQSG